MTREDMNEDAAFEVVAERLAEQHPEAPRTVIDSALEEARGHFDDAAIRDFVPILAERDARAIIEEEPTDEE